MCIIKQTIDVTIRETKCVFVFLCFLKRKKKIVLLGRLSFACCHTSSLLILHTKPLSAAGQFSPNEMSILFRIQKRERERDICTVEKSSVCFLDFSKFGLRLPPKFSGGQFHCTLANRFLVLTLYIQSKLRYNATQFLNPLNGRITKLFLVRQKPKYRR